MISNNTGQIDLKLLDGLSAEEKKYALEILKQYAENGQSNLLEELQYGDFEEIPVGIDEFLDNPEFLGKSIWSTDIITGEKRDTLFPYWRETLHKIFPDNLTTACNTLILTGSIGLGKAQPLESLVLTKDGFKQIGKLTLTDKVYGNDGQLHDLLGIFPQGKRNIYKISFNDHTSTECCEDHLWTVYNVKTQKWANLTVKDLLKHSIHQSSGHKYKIPLTKPVSFDKKPIKLPPYTMGVLLGDGTLTQHPEVACAAEDAEIITNITLELTKFLPGVYLTHKANSVRYSICDTGSNRVKQAIKDYKLNTTFKEKYIPADYLYSDIADRVAILQGLMDTDGSIDKNGRLMFVTGSIQLKNDFIQLVQSLGGVCKSNYKSTSYYNSKLNKKINGSGAYYIGLKLPKEIQPFKLTRKLARLNGKALAPSRYITNIEYIGEKDCQCIYIDSDEHLYMTNDFIVTHNTQVAVTAMLYLLYRVLCLKDPYGYFGLMNNDKITFSMLNCTIDAAKGVAWSKLQQMVQLSPWFMSHGSLNASRVNPTWQPNKKIELIFGSSNNHVIGRALFSNFSDEVNFSGMGTNVEKNKKKLLKMIGQIDARMISRFGKGTYLPTLNIIASSKDTDQSFLDSYIETKHKNESKTTLIIDEPQWVVRNDKGSPEDPGAFWVAVGGLTLAHELLPVNATEDMVDRYRAKGYHMIKVPPIYREHFETNLDQALMDDAGISSASTTKFISGARLNAAKIDGYINPFLKDTIEVGNDPNDKMQYFNFFDLSAVPPECHGKPMFIHLDLSISGDKTGIAGTWIMGKTPTIEGQDSSLSLKYRLAFSVSVKAPKGFQVSFEKTRTFIKWLREQGFAIKGISADTFNSANLLQELKADGFRTEIISVDRVDTQSKTCVPYYYLKSALYEQRVELYQKCDLLTDELILLERLSDGHIDHPKNGSKDQADAFCGSLYLASKFAEEFAFSYGESLEAAFETNILSDEDRKKQMVKEFQTMLAGLYEDDRKYQEQLEKEQREEYMSYQDIIDGIIVI